MSMYSIAKSIGLPATYVELRHQATHEELPSLSKLRTATQKALMWIWEYYWVNLTANDDGREEAGGVTECREFVKRVVGEENDERRRELHSHLSNWEEDELLMAITEVQWTEKDSKILLRCLELHRNISNRGATSSGTTGQGIKVENLDKLRQEMASMEQCLEDDQDESRAKHRVEEKAVPLEEGNGWTMWEGPWVPKPIGLV
ncbi:hypothetical protein HYFRA_00011904 [Hymenoscyphus fraxineus]|uniref:Las1-like protein n=1 Tax=Hymenoscyphus fraxineus TaxID=746836 RepID=A0A9N9L1R2_9HELO|nr:hypothetical protein HYFRA_00011904 [Hymenoscyphus fraxineus]